MDTEDFKNHDADASSTRESSYFARELGDEWQAEEPGIYRHVAHHKPEFDLDQHPATHQGSNGGNAEPAS